MEDRRHSRTTFSTPLKARLRYWESWSLLDSSVKFENKRFFFFNLKSRSLHTHKRKNSSYLVLWTQENRESELSLWACSCVVYCKKNCIQYSGFLNNTTNVAIGWFRIAEKETSHPDTECVTSPIGCQFPKQWVGAHLRVTDTFYGSLDFWISS